MSSNTKMLKSGIWYTASSFLTGGIGFITTPIFTRLLTKEEFGNYNNYLSWLAVISIFVTLRLESTLISARFDFREQFDEYILSMLAFSSFSALLWLLASNLFSGQFVRLFEMPQSNINLMLLYLLFLPAVSMFQERERYYFAYKKTVALNLLLSIGTACLSVMLVLLMEDRLTGRIIGAVAPTVVLGGILCVFFLKRGKRIRLAYLRYALPVSLPYIPHLLSIVLLHSSDRLMIKRFCSAEAVALYSVAYTCGSVVTLLLTGLNSAYVPWLGEKLDRGEHREVRRFSYLYITFFLFLMAGLMLVTPEILLVLGGDSYMEAKYVMVPVSMGCVCQFLYTMFVNVEQIKKKTKGMAVASLLAALINVWLNYLFIPRIGYLAAAYTTLFGYLCLLLMHMFLVYRLKLNEVYNYGFVLLAVGVGGVVMVLVTFLYGRESLRYCFCCIYVAIVVMGMVKNRSKLLSFVRRRDG